MSTLYHCGIDWLTMTGKTGEEQKKLFELVQPVVEQMAEEGDHVKEARELQYQGLRVGTKGYVFYGERVDGAMLRGSGKAAEVLMDRLRRRPDLAAKVTRLDLQATVIVPEMDEKYIKGLGDLSHAASRKPVGKGRPWHVEVKYTYGRGDTCYLGDRRAEGFGRAYDKHKEMPKDYPEGSLRFELETKGSLARQHLDKLLRVEHDTTYTVSQVKKWFERRGVPVPVDKDDGVPLLTSIPRVTDDEKALDWLARCVRPAVDRLKARGRLDDVLHKLDIYRDVFGE